MAYRKYGNQKVTFNGKTFDSKKEARRFKELSLLEKAGAIQDLKTQVKYVLIPTQREQSTEVYKKGAKKGQLKPGKIIEKECAYIADFEYYKDGVKVVEDTKGFRTSEYILKRKMLFYFYGIRINEI